MRALTVGQRNLLIGSSGNRESGGLFQNVSVSYRTLGFHAALLALLTGVAALARLGAQAGIMIYPDSYQFTLLAEGLAHSLPVDALMGSGGDPWAIPFHRLGYSFVMWPAAQFTDDPLAPGLIVSFAAGVATIPATYLFVLAALRQRGAAVVAALAVALSFSGVAWSRFVMSEALAAFVISLTLLLCALAGRTREPSLGAAAGFAAAAMVLVRFELLLVIPSCALVVHVLSNDPRSKRMLFVFLLSWAVSLVVVGSLWGWCAHDALENFTLNPLFYVKEAFEGPPERTAETIGLAAGVWDFFSHEPILLVGAVLGTVWSIRQFDPRVLAIWPGLILLFLLYVIWNDVRHFATLVPLLAYLTGFGFYHSGRRATDFMRTGPAEHAAALSAVGAIFLVGLLSMQVYLTEAPWHPDEAYEYEIARGVERHVEDLALYENLAVCGYSPEAQHLITGLPAKRLSESDLSLCTDGTYGDHVLVVVDAAVRSHFGYLFESQLKEFPPLFQVATSAPYWEGRSIKYNVSPAVVYLLR